MKCPRCKKLHRELPDILAPYKHYHLDIIMGMLEGTLTVGEDEFEDYPCEKTVERWNAWLQQNRIAIDGYMKSVGYRLLGYGEELLHSTVSLLEKMRCYRMSVDSNVIGAINECRANASRFGQFIFRVHHKALNDLEVPRQSLDEIVLVS